MPLAEEIRAARADAEAARRASVELTNIDVALKKLKIRHEVMSKLGKPVDPDDVHRESELHEQRAAVEPEAQRALQLGTLLGKLLAEQHDSLHHPGHEQTVVIIKALGKQRQEVWDELEPVWQRVKVVEPVVELIERHLAELAGARDRAVEAVARKTSSLIVGIERALSAIGFEIGVPDQPGPTWIAIDEAADGLTQLAEILTEERESLRARRDVAQARYDDLTAQIMAITG